MKLFVVTPHYSDPSFSVKRELIVKIATMYNIEVLFGSNEGSEASIDESLTLMESADLVLADLSLERPSCYYEVGFAQAKNKLVHLIATLDTVIHQVRLRNKIHFYKDLFDYEELIDRFLSTFTTH